MLKPDPLDKSVLYERIKTIFSQSASLLPVQKLQAFVRYHFERRQYYLDSLETHPAPVYLFEPEILKARARQLHQAFSRHLSALSFFYAVKSNNFPMVARTLLEEGFGLDVSSGMELEMVLELGAGEIVFSGPGKTNAELETAVANDQRVTVLLDSPGELHRLEDVAAGHGKIMRCGVRLTVDTQGLWRKFGIAPETLPAFWEATCHCPHIYLSGLQFHSSWNLTPRTQIMFIRNLAAILKQMPLAFHEQLDFIDIGGGYWPPQGEWLQPAATEHGRLCICLGHAPGSFHDHYYAPATPIDDYGAQLCSAIEQYLFPIISCRICLEPGRWLCNDAMHLLITVVDKKADDLVITDAGTNSIGWERFESDYFPILNLTRPGFDEKPCHILGSLCTPHDVWGYMYFGDCIDVGDILLIPTQGAYTYSLRQNFIKPLPDVVVL
jgi:diaminopimelate decarboxylase